MSSADNLWHSLDPDKRSSLIWIIQTDWHSDDILKECFDDNYLEKTADDKNINIDVS